MCLNFASFLEEHNFFEDSFRVYEKAVVRMITTALFLFIFSEWLSLEKKSTLLKALFGFPQVKPIWLLYLDKFMARYGGSKLGERKYFIQL